MKLRIVLLYLIAIADAVLKNYELRIYTVNVILEDILTSESRRTGSLIECFLFCRLKDVTYASFCQREHICTCEIKKVKTMEESSETRKFRMLKTEKGKRNE